MVWVMNPLTQCMLKAACPQAERSSGQQPCEAPGNTGAATRLHSAQKDCKEQHGKRSEAQVNTSKATTLQGTAGQADQQLGNRAVKRKATATRQTTYKARKQKTRKARPADGWQHRQGSGAAKRQPPGNTNSTAAPHSEHSDLHTTTCEANRTGSKAAMQRRQSSPHIQHGAKQHMTYSHHDEPLRLLVPTTD
ncbi:hypothetical protein CBR_g8144 [Chara braunii]|uniref:Uncharacterized protein n=1 Tax=Chara braunii TaxID=69332 RepID=A0A388KLB2_CHABU|nr:hypothetical protein CBR_g8144 [Chara braunii]|eukprot:GBG70844.1 hypothetical protein CBR_g8144 [Chara braunii]